MNAWLASEGTAERAARGLCSGAYDPCNLSTADSEEICRLLFDPSWSVIRGHAVTQRVQPPTYQS